MGTYTLPTNSDTLDVGIGNNGVYDFHSIAEDNSANIEDAPGGSGYDTRVTLEHSEVKDWKLIN